MFSHNSYFTKRKQIEHFNNRDARAWACVGRLLGLGNLLK